MFRRGLVRHFRQIFNETNLCERPTIWITYGSQWMSRRPFSTKPAFKGPLSFLSLGLALATGMGCLYYYERLKEQKLQSESQSNVQSSIFEGMIEKQTQSVGTAAIGGPFSLIDQHKKPFTEQNLKNEFSVLYFGFTQCPDICPDELDKIAEAVKIIGKHTAFIFSETAKETKTGVRIHSVFITLDPERDGPELINSYVREFDEKMIGLTGSRKQINAAAKAYRVYHSKANEYGSDYLIDHSIITYLLDPNAQFMTFYGKNFTAEQLAESIIKHMKNWAKEHQDYKKAHPRLHTI